MKNIASKYTIPQKLQKLVKILSKLTMESPCSKSIFARLIGLLIVILISPCAYAAEELIGATNCPVTGRNGADWDTIAECQSTAGTWKRAPFFVGSTSDGCDSSHAGMLQWTGTAMEYCNGTIWTAYGSGGQASLLNGLTAGTAINSFDNGTYAQTWTWNTMTTQSEYTLSSSSLTTGTLVSLANSNTASSTGPVLNVSSASTGAGFALYGTVSGTNNTSDAGYFSNSSATGWGVYSPGTSPSSFSGSVNVASGYSYQIAGTAILTLPDGDTTSIAVGSGALTSQNATGEYNSAVGVNAAYSDTSGSYNTAVGYEALYSNVSGNGCTAVGYSTLYSATACPNDAFGTIAGYYISTGTANVALGYSALHGSGSAITGNGNVAAGEGTLQSLQGSASGNTAAGYEALQSLTTTNGSSAMGFFALGNATAQNDAFGYMSGYNVTSGNSNLAVGYQAMGGAGTANLSAFDNVAVGSRALTLLTGLSSSNTAVGYQALTNASAISGDTAVGYQALDTAATSGSGSTGIGANVLNNATQENDGFGDGAGINISTGNANVALGYEALSSSSGLTGYGNTIAGYSSGEAFNGAATGNTAFGSGSCEGLNVAQGDTCVGYQTTASSCATCSNSAAIGYGADITASNQFSMGGPPTTKIYAQVTSITAISDRRLKKDIVNLPPDLGLSFIEKLRPVSYRYNNGDETERYGFIAQDIEQALPASLQTIVETAPHEHGLALIERQNDKQRTYFVSYSELLAPIVEAIQEHEKTIESDEAILAQSDSAPILEDQVQHLDAQLDTQNLQMFIRSLFSGVLCLGAGLFLGRYKRN